MAIYIEKKSENYTYKSKKIIALKGCQNFALKYGTLGAYY